MTNSLQTMSVKGKNMKEWHFDTPWGKLAMISWGNPQNDPVLMVHGFMDSAATFIPLIEHLPDIYYYVSFDLPGHGKSFHIETGPNVTYTFHSDIMRRVVEYMQWDTFVFLSHSIAFIMGILYQHMYPGKIKKMINIDPLLPTATVYDRYNNDHYNWYQYYYQYYYDFYKRIKSPKKMFKYDQVVKLTMLTREVNREQAELLLSRMLVPVENGLYTISTQQLMRAVVPWFLFEDTLQYIIETNPPYILNINSTDTMQLLKDNEFINGVIKSLNKSNDFASVTVEGSHDVHITKAELLAEYMTDFLGSNFKNKSKL